MDGRRFAALGLVAAVAALGCRGTPKTPTPPAAMNTNPSLFDRVLAPKPPGPIKQPLAEPEADVKGPLKSETVAIFADITVEAAFNDEKLTAAERDSRLDVARQRFQTALKQDPKNLDALRGMGRLYTRLGDKERAAQLYQTALQVHPKNHALAHEAALSYGRFEDWAMALSMWQHALSLDPASRKYPRMIGLAQARLGNYEAGFNTLLKICSEAEARTVMAREMLDAGQTAGGKQQLELAVQSDPAFAPAQQMLQQMSGIQQTGYQQ